MKKKKRKEQFNDLLIPLLFVVCTLPFVIRLAEYSCNYGKYSWYSDNDVIMDLYSYYRCYYFEILAILMAVILAFRMALYKEEQKPCRIFLPLLLYAAMVVASTVLSVNVSASLTGNFHQFQGILVLLGYVILAFYTYQVMSRERDYRIMWYGIAAMFAVMALVGGFQIAKKDLLDVPFMQRLIMSKEQFAEYGGTMETVFTGNNVFLSLYNPNYAGVFLTMAASVFFVMCWSEKGRKKKIWYGLGLFVSLLLMWFTYSRSVFVSVFAALAVFLWMEKKRRTRALKFLLPGLVLAVVGFFALDMANGFRFLSRIADPKKDTALEEILTSEKGVLLQYDGNQYFITVEGGRPAVRKRGQAESPGEEKAEARIKEMEDGTVEIGDQGSVSLEVWEEDGAEWLSVEADGHIFFFGRDSNGYFYLTENGKQDQMAEIEKADFGGLEYLGSGRVYIWSRTLPLLKKYLLAGSGPDTFPEVFPQNDYVGKAVYGDTATRIIEKPHNDYLLQWVQTGFLGMLGMVLFYVFYVKKCVSIYGERPGGDFPRRLGYGCFLGCICYMAGSFFNDGTLYTTPLFWVFIGISLSAGQKPSAAG